MLPFSYYDLLEQFPQEGCALCRLSLRAADRYLDALIYDQTTELRTHADFRARRGLCNTHLWQAMDYQGSALSLGILLGASFDEVLAILESPAEPTGRGGSGLGRLVGQPGAEGSLAARLDPTAACPVCESMAEAERLLIEALCQYLAAPALQDAFEASAGLCLPHFRLALRQPAPEQNRALLIEGQRRIWGRLRGELATFVAKQDYRRSREPMGSERDSVRRAVGLIAGAQGVYGLDRKG